MEKHKKKYIKLNGVNVFLLFSFLLLGLFKGYDTSAVAENTIVNLKNFKPFKNSYTWKINDDSILSLDYKNSIIFNTTHSTVYFTKNNKKYSLGQFDFSKKKDLDHTEILKPILVDNGHPYDIYIFKGVTCYDEKDSKYVNLPAPLIVMDNGELIYYAREINENKYDYLSNFFNISNDENDFSNLAKIDYAFSELMTFNNDILFIKSAEALNNFWSRNSAHSRGLVNLYDILNKYINGETKPDIFNNPKEYISSNDDLYYEYENALNTIKSSQWFIELENKVGKQKETIKNNINENIDNNDKSEKKDDISSNTNKTNKVDNKNNGSAENNTNNNAVQDIDFNENTPLKIIDIKGYSGQYIKDLTRTQAYGLYGNDPIVFSDENGSFHTDNKGNCTFNKNKKLTALLLKDPKVVYYNGTCLAGLSYDELKSLVGSDIDWELNKTDVTLKNGWYIYLGLQEKVQAVGWDVPPGTYPEGDMEIND